MVDRAVDLRTDYDTLGEKLVGAEGSAAAAIARERRLISAELERIGVPEEVPFVDQLAERRNRSGTRRPSTRRRKSG